MLRLFESFVLAARSLSKPLSIAIGASRLRLPLAGAFAIAGATSATAQGLCFEPDVSVSPLAQGSTPALADFDGDGDIDLAFVDLATPTLEVAMNLGAGTFTTPVILYSAPAFEYIYKVVAADCDGDHDVDLAFVEATTLGPAAGSVIVWKNDGTGGFTFAGGSTTWSEPRDMVVGDLDGDLDVDILVTHHVPDVLYILLNNGTGSFTPQMTSLPGFLEAGSAVLGDIDADGYLDILTNRSGNRHTYLNNGNATFTLAGTTNSSVVFGLVDLDADGDLDLATGELTPSISFGIRKNLGNGTFGPVTVIPSPSGTLSRLTFGDLDRDGDVDLAFPRYSAPGLSVLVNQGDATFVYAPDIPGPTYLTWLAAGDLDGDSDLDLLAATQLAGFVQFRNCSKAGAPFCLGDGSATPCPCGNSSAPNAKAGCLNSFGTAGTLRGNGSARIASDTLVLIGSGMTNSSVLYFQGTTRTNGGAGMVFGDGLICAGGSAVRLGTRLNAGGASVFPGPAGANISALGFVTSPGERVYQAWYRNSASFCAPEGFNLTNGLRVLWQP